MNMKLEPKIIKALLRYLIEHKILTVVDVSANTRFFKKNYPEFYKYVVGDGNHYPHRILKVVNVDIGNGIVQVKEYRQLTADKHDSYTYNWVPINRAVVMNIPLRYITYVSSRKDKDVYLHDY